MGQNKKPYTSPYNIFGIPIDGDSGYPQLIRLVSVICGFTLFALLYEIENEKQGIYKSILATIEHSANSVPLSICILILFDLGRRKVMSLSKWLDDKYNEKQERLRIEREGKLIAEKVEKATNAAIAQTKAETIVGIAQARAQGKAEGIKQGRAEAKEKDRLRY